jgi:hypothetical protein
MTGVLEMTIGHPRLTDQGKKFIWRSWRKGQTCEAIGGKIGKTNACVFLYLRRTWALLADILNGHCRI